MHADLRIVAMAAPHRDDQDFWRIDPREAARIGHERIDAFDLADWSGDDLENVAHGLRVRPRTDPHSDVRAALHAALDALLADRSDVVAMLLGGVPYWITGGWSMGDPPTDSYDLIDALCRLDLYDEPLPHLGRDDEQLDGRP